MKAPDGEPTAAADGKKTDTLMPGKAPSGREVLAGAAAVGATILTGTLSAAAEEHKQPRSIK
jgi:hypothetical protein